MDAPAGGGCVPVPGYLSPQECGLLYALARDHYSGRGSIVDLGCFLGRCTNALCAGLSDNPLASDKQAACSPTTSSSYQKARKPTCWSASHSLGPIRAICARPGGLTFRPVFDQTIAQYPGYVAAHEGDFATAAYDGPDIEILFIDIVKSEALGAAVVSKMFPRLIAGHSVVVQQDFHSYYAWEIHFCMDFFSDYFRVLIDGVNASCVFVLVKPIPSELIDDFATTPLGQRYTLEGGVDALSRVQERLLPPYRFFVEINKIRWKAQFGVDVQTDIERLSRVRLDAVGLDPQWDRWIADLRTEVASRSGTQ